MSQIHQTIAGAAQSPIGPPTREAWQARQDQAAAFEKSVAARQQAPAPALPAGDGPHPTSTSWQDEMLLSSLNSFGPPGLPLHRDMVEAGGRAAQETLAAVPIEAWGGLQAAGGALEGWGAYALAVVPEPTGVTKLASAWMALQAAENLVAGSLQLGTGTEVETVSSHVVDWAVSESVPEPWQNVASEAAKIGLAVGPPIAGAASAARAGRLATALRSASDEAATPTARAVKGTGEIRTSGPLEQGARQTAQSPGFSSVEPGPQPLRKLKPTVKDIILPPHENLGDLAVQRAVRKLGAEAQERVYLGKPTRLDIQTLREEAERYLTTRSEAANPERASDLLIEVENQLDLVAAGRHPHLSTGVEPKP